MQVYKVSAGAQGNLALVIAFPTYHRTYSNIHKERVKARGEQTLILPDHINKDTRKYRSH